MPPRIRLAGSGVLDRTPAPATFAEALFDTQERFKALGLVPEPAAGAPEGFKVAAAPFDFPPGQKLLQLLRSFKKGGKKERKFDAILSQETKQGVLSSRTRSKVKEQDAALQADENIRRRIGIDVGKGKQDLLDIQKKVLQQEVDLFNTRQGILGPKFTVEQAIVQMKKTLKQDKVKKALGRATKRQRRRINNMDVRGMEETADIQNILKDRKILDPLKSDLEGILSTLIQEGRKKGKLFQESQKLLDRLKFLKK